MALKTSASAGLASVGSNWVGGVAPVDGDTIQQNHAIIWDQPFLILGTSDVNGVDAVTVANNIPFEVADGAFIDIRGDVSYQGSFGQKANLIIVRGGGIAWFNSSLAADPANTRYTFKLRAGGTGASILLDGTLSKPVIIASDPNGGHGHFNRNGQTGMGDIFATYTWFQSFGDATRALYEIQHGSTGTSASKTNFQNCVFENGGRINATNSAQNNGEWVIKNCVFKGTLASTCYSAPTFTGSGTKDLRGTVCDKPVSIGDGDYIIGDNGIFLESWNGTSRSIPAVISGSLLIRKSTQPSTNMLGDIPSGSKVIYIKDSTPAAPFINAHFCAFGFTDRDYLVDGLIGVYTGTGTDGDFIFQQNTTNIRTFTSRRCLWLPNANGTSSGKFCSGGGSNVNWDHEHNTYISSVDHIENGISWGELAGAHANMYLSVRSNLVWHPTPNKSLIISRLTGSLQDAADPANIEYNAIWNGFTGTDGLGAHSYSAGTAFTGAVNANGVVVSSNPFLDNTRRPETWHLSLGGSGATVADQLANCFAEMRKFNDWTISPGFNPNYSVENLYDYIATGYNVIDPSLENAGHDGVTIGARPFATPAPNSKIRYRYNELLGGI